MKYRDQIASHEETFLRIVDVLDEQVREGNAFILLTPPYFVEFALPDRDVLHSVLDKLQISEQAFGRISKSLTSQLWTLLKLIYELEALTVEGWVNLSLVALVVLMLKLPPLLTWLWEMITPIVIKYILREDPQPFLHPGNKQGSRYKDVVTVLGTFGFSVLTIYFSRGVFTS